ncbi:signal recognition particle subunit SRP68 [Selaginella moellendorffii]|uniref:signal recognition particle subunit SRP68 n=1 Tax=Selaginella moellendorffii TaxID=88036 RepID=UPI000D1C7EBB|nr:signal recognition particle subunit SRP68 [Selaginella moellendorffii]|eukprot:XP_024524518.1 signal recognition particle subunit SRP68 [Selaginella moellendorffii]
MEVEAAAGAAQPQRQGFSFGLLEMINASQAEHGLRHKDYKRYKEYCTNRLRRLYKSVKFTHGRGRYVKKPLGVANVSEVRHLHIALYLAERAWSQAMHLKEEAPTGKGRYHWLGRLRKACKWADLLESLCNEKANPRTALEATAYASYLRGLLLVDAERNWQFALRKFKNARIIYEELGRYGDADNQILYKQRVEEIEQNIRHCLHSLQQMDDAEGPEDESDRELHGKLEAVMVEVKTQEEISTVCVTWLGHKFPVHNIKTRACVLKVQNLERELGSSSTAEKKQGLYEKILGGYQEARKNIREDLATAGNADNLRDSLIGLDKAVSCLIFAGTIERARLQLSIAKSRLSRQQDLATLQEIVTLCDTLNTNLMELTDLATSGREKTDEEEKYALELSASQVLYRAERCFHLAQAYSLPGQHAEAFALLGRAREHAESALRLQKKNESLVEEIQELIGRCRSESLLAHARGVMQSLEKQQEAQEGVSSLSLAESKDNYLLSQLDKYKSALGSPGAAPRISQVPPAFKAVPCRPIFLDTAINSIEFPSLEARLKEKKKGLFGRWGW